MAMKDRIATAQRSSESGDCPDKFARDSATSMIATALTPRNSAYVIGSIPSRTQNAAWSIIAAVQGKTNRRRAIRPPAMPRSFHLEYAQYCIAPGPGSIMQKGSAFRNCFSVSQSRSSTSSRCMSALFDADPLKSDGRFALRCGLPMFAEGASWSRS